MSRPSDPLDDLVRCAELLDQTTILMSRGLDVRDVVSGIADRIREDVADVERART